MSRRTLFSDRNALSRRVLAMMSTLFRRRWSAGGRTSVRAGRRPRLMSRIWDFADSVGSTVASAASKATSTHVLTLSSPEFLEARQVMTIYSGFYGFPSYPGQASYNEDGSGTLAAWIDSSAERMDVFSTDGAGRVTICSSVTGEVFDSTRVQPGTTIIPTKVMLYEENFFPSNTMTLAATQATGGATINFGGSGYTSSPAVNLTLQDPAVGANVRATYGVPAQALSSLTLTAAPGTATATGTTFTAGSTINVTQFASTTGLTGAKVANAVLTLQSSGTWSITSSDSTFTAFSGVNVAVTATSTGNTATGLSLSGRVASISLVNNQGNPAINGSLAQYSGYWGDVRAVFTGGGGSGADLFIDLDEGSYTTTSVVFRPPVGLGASNPITQAIHLGSSDGRYTRADGGLSGFNSNTALDIDTVTITTPIITPTSGSFQGFNVRNVGTYTQNSVVDANAAFFVRALTSVDVGGDIDGGGVTFESTGPIGFTAGTTNSSGAISVDLLNQNNDFTSVGRQFTATGAVTIDADNAAGTSTANIAITLSSGQLLRAGGLLQLRADHDITIDGSGAVASTGSSTFFTSDSGNVSVAGTTLSAQNDVDLQAANTIALEIAASGRFVRAVADTGGITLGKNVSSTGAIYVQADDNIVVNAGVSGTTNVSLIANGRITGVSTISADRLTVSQADATVPLSLNTSVNRLTSSSGNDTSFTNNKSLILEGAYLAATGNVTIDVTGTSSNLTVATPIDLKAYPNARLTLNATGSVSALVAINTSNDVVLTSLNGSVTATQIDSSRDLIVTANTGIDLSGTVKANAFSLFSQSGTINLRAPANAGNVTVFDASTTSGDVLLSATSGNLVIQNQIVTTGGNVSLSATSGKLDIGSAANISIPANRTLTTSSRTAAFTAGATISTGTLNYTSGNDAGILNSANASFHTANAAITGAGNSLNITRSSSLNLTGASTNNAALGVTLSNGSLNVSGPLSAGTGTVTLDVANGSLMSTGSIAGGSITATVQNDASYTGTLTANSTGTVSLTSTNGAISATQTISGRNITANAGGNLTISGAINGATGGLANLTSGGNLTVSGTVVAGGLTTNSTGAQNIANTVNLVSGTADLNSASTLVIGQSLRAGLLNAASTGNLVVSGPLNIGTGNATLTSRAGSLSVSNTVLAGNFTATTDGVQTLSNTITVGAGAIALNAANGAITAAQLLTAGSLDVRARDTSTITTANVSTLTGAITGSAQNLTASFTNSVSIGAANLTANGGTLNLTLSSGNLTRTGEINSSAGTVAINTGTNEILGTGAINTALLQWTANQAPSGTGLTYSVLDANQTGSGDLVIVRPAALEVRRATIANGAININVTTGSLTINGSVDSRGSTANISLAAPAGSILLGSSVGNIVANVLTVAAQNDVSISTDVTTLIGNVTSGSFSVTERDGLIVGAAGINAATDNVTITVSNGDLDRSNSITVGAGKTLTMNVPNGLIIGSAPVSVMGGTLVWSAQAAPADENLTGDSDYSFLSAAVTGIGENLAISRTDNLTILRATTSDGVVNIEVTNPTSDLTINGPVTAGGGNAAYISAGNRIVVSGTNLITAGYLNATAYNDSILRISATTFEGFFDASNVAVVATSALGIGANGVTTTGDIGVDVTDGSLTLNGGLNASTASNVAINVAAGGISGSGLVTANVVDVRSSNSASVVTTAATLVANVTGGSLTVNETDSLTAGILNAADDISITVGGDLDGVDLLTAGQNITLNASSGTVNLASVANQVTAGNLLSLRANGTSAVNTAVASVTATILNDGDTLTLVEGDNLAIDAAGILANGIVSIQAADLAITGGINAGSADLAINLTGGSSGAGVVSGNILTFNAATNSSLNTRVSNVIADVTGGSLSINDADGLAIDGVNAATTLSILAGGDIDGAGNLVAGTDITLNATAGGITLNAAQQISSTGDGLLIINAAGDVDVDVSVGSLTAATGGNLTVADNSTLTVNTSGVFSSVLATINVATGDLTLDGFVSGASGVNLSADAGNVTGSGNVTSTNDVVLNAGDGITLSGVAQVVANALHVTAVNSVDLGTTITSLNATLSDAEATLHVVETNGLSVIAANAPGGVDLTVGGLLDGSGLIDSGSNATVLNVAGSIDLASAGSPQVIASDLDVLSAGSVNINAAITSLNASVTGDLTVADTDDLTIDGTVDAANVALAVDGTISGAGLINAASNVTLISDNVALTDPAQVIASVLRLNVGNDADVNVDVQNLVANVGQSLNIVEASDLFIGVVAGDEVRGDSVNITVTSGNLAGPGDVNAANDVTIILQDTANGSLNLTTGRINANNLTATVQAGSIDLNTAVSNLTAATFQDLGHIAVDQNGDLTVLTIDTVDGNVRVSVDSGNLTIGDGSGDQGILGGQLSNVTLSATGGSIVTNAAVVFGNLLDLAAQNSSTLNTAVTTLVADVAGVGESLSIFEAEELTLNSSTSLDGLEIGLGGVTTANGAVTITLVDDPASNIIGGSLVVNGVIDTRSGGNVGDVFLDVTNGSVTGSGLISGSFLNVAAQNASSLNTNVDTLSANIVSGGLTVTEQDGIAIDATNGVVAQSVSISITGTGSLNVAGDINATTGDLALNTADGNVFGTGAVSSAANVTLIVNGSISLDSSPNQVSGNVLDVNATAGASLTTAVTSLAGNVTGPFIVVEADDLSIAATGVAVTMGDLSLELSTGNLTGAGGINVSGDVILNASLGNVTLTNVDQVTATGNVILTAQNSSAINTSVSGLEASVTDGTLTIVEANGLVVQANGVVADNVSLTLTTGDLSLDGDVTSDVGDISFVVAGGSVSGAGNVISAVNVAISASGEVTLPNADQVSGDVLNLVAGSTSSLGTNITSLFADVSGGSLTVNETDGLTVLAQGSANGVGATNVTISAGGDLTLNGSVTARTGDLNLTTSSGNITGIGIVNAAGDVVLSAAAGNVTLNAVDQVTGQLLTVTAQDDSAVNTAVSSLAADVMGGSLTVFEADGLLVATGNVNAADNVTITIANGNLTGGDVYSGGSITAGDTVALVVNGIVEMYGLQSAGDVGFQGAISSPHLTIQSNSAIIDTNVDTLVADITGSLEVNEETGVTIGSNVNATGDINVVADGLIDGSGLIHSASGNVALTSVANGVDLANSPGQVSGDVVTVLASLASSLETNAATLVANITGPGESLTINEANSLVIGSGNVVTNSGDINIAVGGDLIRTGAIDADSGNVTLNAASGAINGTGMITGNVLEVAAQNSSSLNTTVNTINAAISDEGNTLTVIETDSLTIDAGLQTANGVISVTVGGDLDGPGNINAGSANVSLTAATGDVSVTGTITGNVLSLTAESANLTTDITAINATTTAGGLTLVEASGLRIDGLSIAGDIDLDIAGDITGTGVLSASNGASNVTLSSSGGIVLNAANQIVANVLNVTATNASSLGTKVNTLLADIGGLGESLTVVEADGLTIGSGNVATTDGNISITSGSIQVNGGIDAGTANVSLAVNGTVSGSGLITANQLDLGSTQSAGVTTDVNLLNASVTTGTLAVTETDDLTIVNATASGDITLNAAAGTINGTGPVNSTSGNVSLIATDVALTAANQVRGNVLSVNVSGSADINTSVNTLTASNVGGALNIVEANSLAIGLSGISGANATINLVTGGGLTFTGGVDVRPTGAVDLNVIGSISGAGQIKADTLNAVATGSSTLNTSVNNLSAQVTSTGQSLAIIEADSLTITGDNVTTVNGPISLTLTTGSLTIDGVLSAGSGAFGTVDLNVANGRINTTASGTINGTSLALRALNSSEISTNVGTLTANITGVGQGLEVTEFDALTVGTSGVLANGGDITLTVGDQAQGSFLLSGPVNAGSGNVTLDVNFAISGNGLVSGNVLDVTVVRSASLNTRVEAIQGDMTGNSQTLAINEFDGINIASGNLVASGSNGKILVTANGPIGGSGSVIANTGTSNVTLNATNGGIGVAGDIDAGSQGTVVLLSTGNVTMGNPRQITADTLVLNSTGSANIGTEVAKLSAVVRNANATLTVSEYDGLQILANTAVTNNGAIAITAGTGAAGDLVISGPVNAVLNTVTLSSQDGGISTTGSGLVTGGNLFITSLGNVALATNVTGLAALVQDSGSSLTINEANGLTILNNSNVVQTTDGNIAITLAAGNLVGAGVINAGTGDVTLDASSGAITLTAANQVRGGALTATANGTSSINTAVDSLNVTLRGTGSALNIVEADDVSIARVSTVNGIVSIRSLTGSLTGTGNLTAGSANVSLTAANAIGIDGQITANNLALLASNGDVDVNTTVSNVSANATGSITINETDNLTLLPAGLNGGTDITVNAGGAINGTGNVVANTSTGQIILNAASGTTLTTRAGQVRGDSLLVAGGGTSLLNTNVTNLAATLSGSLTVNETNGLSIDPDVDTSIANGNVTLNVLQGNLAVTSDITAGSGIVTLSVPNGNISGAGTISASHLAATAKTGIDVTTNVTTLSASVSSTGNLTVNEVDGITVLTATTTRGNISLTAGGDIETRTITGRVAPLGNVAFDTPGNLSINGALTTNVLDLSQVDGDVTVLAGGTIRTGRAAGSVINQTTGNGVIWQVNTNNDTGAGSLRTAITNINGFQGLSQLTLADRSITVNSQLPTISRAIRVGGNGNVTIQGAANNRFSGLTLSATGSSVDGIRLANFGAPALYLIGGRSAAVDIDVTNVTIDNSRIGIQAVNLLGGSTISDTTVGFSNLANTYRTGSYGIMLSAAQGISLGEVAGTGFGSGAGNSVTVSNVAIGIAATGNSAGSFIRRAEIRDIMAAAGSSGYALSLASVTGLTITASSVSNSTTGLFASGFCTGSTVSGMSFVSGVGTQYNVRNSRNLLITT